MCAAAAWQVLIYLYMLRKFDHDQCLLFAILLILFYNPIFSLSIEIVNAFQPIWTKKLNIQNLKHLIKGQWKMIFFDFLLFGFKVVVIIQQQVYTLQNIALNLINRICVKLAVSLAVTCNRGIFNQNLYKCLEAYRSLVAHIINALSDDEVCARR